MRVSESIIYKNNCKLCGLHFENVRNGVNSISRHLKSHQTSIQAYYDTYFKRDDEGICVVCGKTTQWNEVYYRYNLHCSTNCKQVDNSKYSHNSRTERFHNNNPMKKDCNKELARLRMSENNKVNWKDENYRNKMIGHTMSMLTDPTNNFGYSKNKQEYKGFKLRSKLELNFVKLCELNNIKFEYEPKWFHLKSVNKRYLPDFFLPELNLWVEIKDAEDYKSYNNWLPSLFKTETNQDLIVLTPSCYNQLLDL